MGFSHSWLAVRGRPAGVDYSHQGFWSTGLVIVFAIFGLVPASLAQDLRNAVRDGNVERVKSLLESGADANTSYENRFTPIHFADDPRIVDLLLAHGAKLDIRDAASIQSPIEDAAENYFRDEKRRDNWKIIVTKLRDAG